MGNTIIYKNKTGSQAIQWNGEYITTNNDFGKFLENMTHCFRYDDYSSKSICIYLKDSYINVEFGDFIIKNKYGNFVVYSSELFKKTFQSFWKINKFKPFNT